MQAMAGTGLALHPRILPNALPTMYLSRCSSMLPRDSVFPKIRVSRSSWWVQVPGLPRFGPICRNARRPVAGRNWLFFGEQRSRCDFFYQEEFERFQKEGVLTRFDTAFSR